MINTNYISKNLLRLPLHLNLKKKEIEKVCKTIENFFIN
jgi:dTDP-4-amino-4,6-dideoxygalactose transaminase